MKAIIAWIIDDYKTNSAAFAVLGTAVGLLADHQWLPALAALGSAIGLFCAHDSGKTKPPVVKPEDLPPRYY